MLKYEKWKKDIRFGMEGKRMKQGDREKNIKTIPVLNI